MSEPMTDMEKVDRLADEVFDDLNKWEQQFIDSLTLMPKGYLLTAKQGNVLDRLYEKHLGERNDNP